MTWQPIPQMAPDVELWATTYLRTELLQRPEHVADAFVSNKVPTTRRDRMVIVRRDGGRTANLRDIARVNVRCWAKTDQDAIDLARLVSALLFDAPGADGVLRVVQQSGPIPVADESGQPMRMSVYEIHSRAEVLT